SERFGVGKETVGDKSGIVGAKSQPQARGLPHRVYAPGSDTDAISSKRSEEGLRLSLAEVRRSRVQDGGPFNLQGNELSAGYTL
ncbi:hypothetical protein ABTK84_19985, partial [Acinetobacter baumannii]